MPGILQKTVKLLIGSEQSLSVRPKKSRPLKKLTERELISLESEIGAKLFGPVATGHRREFFCLDKDTWIWYEEWTDTTTGKSKSLTTRYEIREDKILKAQEGAQYSFLEGKELQNLLTSIQLYYEQVARDVYKRDPQTRQKLV